MIRIKNILSSQKGMTLFELMIACAISVWVIGAVISVYMGQRRTSTQQEQVVNIQQSLRASASVITNDMRMAGFDPTGDLDSGITSITANGSITFTMDQDGTGNANDTISYSTNANNDLVRTINGANQDLAEDITNIEFAYSFDEDGDGAVDTYNAGGTERVIWAIDSDGDGDLDANLDTDGDGVIDENDGPGPGGNGTIAGQALVDFTGNAINDVLPANIRSIRFWMMARTNRQDDEYLNTTTFTVGRLVITPNADADATNDNLRLRVFDSSVKCKNMGY